MCKIPFLFVTLLSCFLATSLAHAQDDPYGDSDVIGSIDLGGSPLALTVAGLDANGTGYLIFFVEDTLADQSEDDEDELWVVIVNGAGVATYLNIFEQDNGAHVASSDIDMPLLDFMNGAGLTTTDSCEYNPLCFG